MFLCFKFEATKEHVEELKAQKEERVDEDLMT